MATRTVSPSDRSDREQIWREFREAVNMTPSELADWLDTDESGAVGWTREGEGETVGHASGRKILAIKHKKKADLTDDDYRHMRRVTGYVHRHLAQGRPEEDVRHSRWRYSLMNWGHDPLKR